MNRSPLRAFLLIPLLLACFALSPQARAVCQDACLTNFNTVQGDDALFSLDTTKGFDNTAMGFNALFNNTTGFANTAIGANALLSNTTGFENTAIGLAALFSNTDGFNNTAIGDSALFSNTTGRNNIALGDSAGINLTTGKNNIDIGNAGFAGEGNKIRIGTTGTQTKTFIAGISGATVASGVG